MTVNKIKMLCIILLGLPVTIPMLLLGGLLGVFNTIYFVLEDEIRDRYRNFLIRSFNYKEN